MHRQAHAQVSRPTSVALLLLAFSLCDCAALMPTCRTEGGSPWWSTRSEHFAVKTNLDRQDAEQATVLLERLHSALSHFLLLERVAATEAQPVVVLRSPVQFAALSGETTRSGFTKDLGDQRLIVISAHSEALVSDVFEARLVAHELTHQLLAQRASRVPRWLSEGLALYLETIEFEDDGHATIGKLNWPRRFVKTDGLTSPAKLWSWDRSEVASNDTWLYATSWLALHYLVTERPVQLAAFLQRIADQANPRDAWAEVFTDLNDERFAATLADHASAAVEHLTRVESKPGATLATTEELGDVEVHLLQAMATLSQKTARLEVARALAHDAHHERARVRQGELSDDPRVLSALASDFPRSAAVMRLLGSRSRDLVERERLLRESLRLTPDDPTTNVELAATLLALGKGPDAEPYARFAFERCPTRQRMIRVWAAVLAGTGRCAEAVAQQRFAIARLSDEADPVERQKMTESLKLYETRCRR
jgi:hypothetical protein